MNIAYNMDCMEAMRQMPDQYFDLAVVDPPYGGAGNEFKRRDKSRFGGNFDQYKTDGTVIGWDNPPGADYFNELFRVSKEQIIWGGNYFQLPPNRCFIVWHKSNIPENFSMSMAEYAWCSFNENAKVVTISSSGRGDRFHPTQKPVQLYAWIFNRYAKLGDKILDTHLGSGSSRIAAYNAGLDFVGFEIDPDYFQAQEERYAAHIAQMSLFN